MAKCKLFEGWTFRLRRPAPFDGPDGDGAKDFGQSRYNTAGPVQKATLHAPTLRALLAYSRLRTAEEKGETDDTLGALGHQSTDYAVAEYHSARKTDCAAYCRHTGKFVAAQFPDGTARPVPYTLGAGQASGTALLFALMPLFEEDEEFRDYAERFRLQQEADWPDREEALRTALVLCDNIYRRVENARNVGPAAVPLQIPVSGSISPIGALALDRGTYAPTGVLYGTFRYFMPQESGGPGMAPARPAAEFAGKYRLHPRTLSQREEALVPQLPDWY